MALTASFGALELAFAWTWHGEPPEFDSRPMLRSEGGTVGVARLGDGEFLVLDHRAAPGGVARVEFWTATGSCEGGAPDLLLIADARPGASADGGALWELCRQHRTRRRPVVTQGGCTS